MIDNETLISAESVISLPPKTIVGYRANGMPVYNIAGGASDVVTGDDDDESGVSIDSGSADSDDDDDEDDRNEQDSWTPPSREDYLKLIADKKKADSEAAARKRFLRDAGLDPKTGVKVEKPTVELEDEDDDEDSTKESKGFNKEKYVQQFERQLEREVSKAERSGRVSAYALIHEVPAALETAGWNGKNLARMTRLLELDDLEIDSDGIDAEALVSKVDGLKKDFPEFFKRTRMKDAAKEVADTAAVGGGAKQAPASEEDLDWKAKMKLQLHRGNN